MKWTDLSLSALQYFTDAIDLASLTLAAEKNHISRPAISQAIRRMENLLGYELIVHSKNRLELTEEGRVFYQKAKRSLEAFNSELAGLNATPELNIACSATIAEYFVLPALKKLKLGKVRIQIGTSAKVRQLVADGEAQLGLIINDNKTFGFSSKVIANGHFVLQSKSGKFSGPLITTENRPEVTHLFKTLNKQNQEFEQYIQVESWSVCRKTMETLGGTCLVPDLIDSHGFKQVRDIKYSFPYDMLAIFKNQNTLSKAELDLLEKLKI